MLANIIFFLINLPKKNKKVQNKILCFNIHLNFKT